MEDIKDQEQLGRLGRDNPPLFVSSVTYGRILLFTMTSTGSVSDIKGALDYAYKGLAADISADLKAKYQKILSSSQINIVPYGGPWQDAAALIRSANLKNYFPKTAPSLSTAVPISYKLNDLADGSTATVAETTSYDKKECRLAQAPAVKKNGKFRLQYVGGGDNRYLSIAEWRNILAAGKWPYPTLQLRPVTLQFRGNKDLLKSGTNIRFVTLEGKAQGRTLGRVNELGRWASKQTVFYDKPDKSVKQNWILP